MDKMTIIWLILLITFLVVECATVTLTCIWFAAGSLVAMLLSIFNVPFWIQLVVAIIVSALLVIFTKPILSKCLLSKRTKTNYESIIGQKAKVIAEINNIENTGSIMLNGIEWTARSKDNVVIKEDTIVEVVSIEGVKAIVK